MHKMTANTHWLPYQQLIVNNNLRNCVDFSHIEAPIPFDISVVTGIYQAVPFQFSDMALQNMVFDLNYQIR